MYCLFLTFQVLFGRKCVKAFVVIYYKKIVDYIHSAKIINGSNKSTSTVYCVTFIYTNKVRRLYII